MSTVPAIRTTAPYIGMLMLSACLDLFGLHNRFLVDLELAHKASFSAVSPYLGILSGMLWITGAGFWIYFILKILPAIIGRTNLNRRLLRTIGLLATVQFLDNLLLIFIDTMNTSVKSYHLLMEGILLYFMIGFIFVFWYWFFDYPSRSIGLATDVQAKVNRISFPEEMGSSVNNWQPGLLDYFFLAMVAGINLGIAEGHSLMGSRLKVAHLFHTLCMSAIFIIIVARAIDTMF